MNPLNHVLFSIFLGMLFLYPENIVQWYKLVIISLIVNFFMDLDHRFNRKAPWYFKRTWIQEPLSIFIIALPIYLALSVIDKVIAFYFLITWIGHIIADYLCIFPTRPLAPLNNNILKPDGFGIFYPVIYEEKWKEWMRERNIKAISENYFTLLLIILLILIIIV